MSGISRRQLAKYAADQVLEGQPTKKIASQLAATLIESRKVNDVEFLINDISWELERRGEIAVGNVISASPLSIELREQIARFIKNKARVSKVELEENVDKSVIGGVRIETAIHAWDKTIAGQLKDVREAF